MFFNLSEAAKKRKRKTPLKNLLSWIKNHPARNLPEDAESKRQWKKAVSFAVENQAPAWKTILSMPESSVEEQEAKKREMYRYIQGIFKKAYSKRREKAEGQVSESTDPRDIKVTNPGILEIPKDKNMWEMPIGHYEELVKSKGYAPVIRALLNHVRWKTSDKAVSFAKKTMKYLRNKFPRKAGRSMPFEEETQVEQEFWAGTDALEIKPGEDWYHKPDSYYTRLASKKGHGVVRTALLNMEIFHKHDESRVKRIYEILKALNSSKLEAKAESYLKKKKRVKELRNRTRGLEARSGEESSMHGYGMTESETLLPEYQVASGSSYMERKKRDMRPKNPKQVKAALKRWNKYGAKYIQSFYKNRNSAKGKIITASLKRFLKKRNSPMRTEEKELLTHYFLTSLNERERELFSLALPSLLEREEFLADLAFSLLKEEEREDVEFSPYINFLAERLHRSHKSQLLEMSLREWRELKEKWNVSLMEEKIEEDRVLFEALDDEGTHWGTVLQTQGIAGYNTNPFSPENTNPRVQHPVGSKRDENPLDIIATYGEAWDYSYCPVCSAKFFYPVSAGNPKCCAKHGGMLAFEKNPKPIETFPTMAKAGM